jgi:aminomethyltransferase
LKTENVPGGIVDDTVITSLGNGEYYFVTNAACREKDADFLQGELLKFKSQYGAAPSWEVMSDAGLVALQGPLAADILEAVLVDGDKGKLRDLFFGQCKHLQVKFGDGSKSSPLLVSRGGYTGEDGFEISIPGPETVHVTETLLKSATQDKLRLAGLGARDSLRLEAGMCLYGHDLDESITPPEAALGWIVGKDRRGENDPTKGAFNGAEKVNAQLLGKSKGGIAIERRRVGLVVEGGIAREGATIHDGEGNQVGRVTSGCPAPTLGKNIAMGYIKSGLHKAGTEVQVEVRKKMRKATVTKMPFISTKYYKG